MKIKLIAVYLAAGAAFLAVSLWVFLTGGKSAKAVSAKFKLGGIMLTTWSMLSAASCASCTPPVVTCYEPVEPQVMCYDVAMETDILSVKVKDYEGTRLKPGDVLLVSIDTPTFQKYIIRVKAGEKLLQEASFTVTETTDKTVTFELSLAPTDHKGEASVEVYGVRADGDGNESEYPLHSSAVVTIV